MAEGAFKTDALGAFPRCDAEASATWATPFLYGCHLAWARNDPGRLATQCAVKMTLAEEAGHVDRGSTSSGCNR